MPSALPISRWALVIVLALAASITMTLLPAPAQASHRPSDDCTASGDVCTDVARTDGVRTFFISTLSFEGRYRLCVTAPTGERECKRFTLQEGEEGDYNDTVRWRRHFSHYGAGAYKVSWHRGGNRLGRVLGFHQ